MDVRIVEGWPNAALLDMDLQGKTLIGSTNDQPIPRPNGVAAQVSVFPMVSATAEPYQIQPDTFVIVPPVYGLTVSVVGNVITVTGTPGTGEYLTIVADRNYVYSSGGATAAVIIAALAAAALVNYPGVTYTSSTLTIPFGFQLNVRQGAIGTLGQATHRQRHSIMITVWSPTHAIRSTLASAIDVFIKNNIRITLPDTSQALVKYERTNVIDEEQMVTIYRRDLIYDVEYATVWQFPGYVITSVDTSVANYNNSSIVPVTT
jgi:hypothetical protein